MSWLEFVAQAVIQPPFHLIKNLKLRWPRKAKIIAYLTYVNVSVPNGIVRRLSSVSSLLSVLDIVSEKPDDMQMLTVHGNNLSLSHQLLSKHVRHTLGFSCKRSQNQ